MFTGRGDRITGRSVEILTQLGPDPVHITGSNSPIRNSESMMSLTIRTHVESICGWAKRSKLFVGWVKRSKLFVGWVKRSKLFVLSLLALTTIAGVHAVLANERVRLERAGLPICTRPTPTGVVSVRTVACAVGRFGSHYLHDRKSAGETTGLEDALRDLLDDPIRNHLRIRRLLPLGRASKKPILRPNVGKPRASRLSECPRYCL